MPTPLSWLAQGCVRLWQRTVVATQCSWSGVVLGLSQGASMALVRLKGLGCPIVSPRCCRRQEWDVRYLSEDPPAPGSCGHGPGWDRKVGEGRYLLPGPRVVAFQGSLRWWFLAWLNLPGSGRKLQRHADSTVVKAFSPVYIASFIGVCPRGCFSPVSGDVGSSARFGIL